MTGIAITTTGLVNQGLWEIKDINEDTLETRSVVYSTDKLPNQIIKAYTLFL